MTDTRDNLWGEAGLDEEVEVDHRALIDKILARYAGEFTVFRELLQNSDDASAKTVEIHFQTREHLDKLYNRTHTSETSATIPDLQTRVFVQWMFRHDGNLFTDADWNRLSKIAEGNPDEEKIGAFGVGFYSVFSVTDEPLVRSGKQWMGFYWKDSQLPKLVARVGEIPSSMENEIAPSGSPWSIFDIFLREEAPFSGNYLEFTRFLATSLTFVQHIVQVSVFIDDHQVAHIQKEMDQPKQMTVPPYFNRTTPLGMMDLKGVHTNEFHITARVMRWIHQSKKAKQSSVDPQRESTELQASESMETGPLDNVVSSIVLTIYSAQVSVRPEKSLSDELFRATKKKLPETCACSLIYIEKDDTTDKENSVFRGLQADLDAQGTGRIFIGHATSQSTGMGGHVSARFIPTVERESVDLVDQHVSKWNKELLYIIGLLGRFVYDMEISRVRDSWDQATKDVGPANRISEVIATQLDARGNRLLQFFSFYPTTPSRLVGKEIEAAFFSCAPDQAFLIMSTTGVQPARQVLFHDKIIKGFTKSLSMISCSAEQEPSAIVKHLRARGMLQDVTVQDVLDGLSKHLLQTEELVECLKWRIKIAEQISSHDKELIHQRFLQNTTFYLSKDGIMGGDELKLSSIKTFVTPSNRIPWNCPFPPHTLPFLISSNFQPSKLRSVFGWNELCIADWATYLVAPSTQNSSEKTVTTSATFAEEILNIIATTWATLPEGEKVQLKTILKEKTVVPTTSGMMKPEESYLPSVDLFEDLPIVSLPSGALDDDLSNLLSFLGVKKHVEINLIFHRFDFMFPPASPTAY
ncbi:hypothetical protein FRC02_007727 [Tulasnella sp. 418]|nr:hypothetical protein FRC02_007727 [Tulasnella sp. 418]